jgi:hypothetical protein
MRCQSKAYVTKGYDETFWAQSRTLHQSTDIAVFVSNENGDLYCATRVATSMRKFNTTDVYS